MGHESKYVHRATGDTQGSSQISIECSSGTEKVKDTS